MQQGCDWKSKEDWEHPQRETVAFRVFGVLRPSADRTVKTEKEG
jgi:hypothetical protein